MRGCNDLYLCLYVCSDFDANFCDTYRCLAGKEPARLRIPMWFLISLVWVVQLIETFFFLVFGVQIQDPVTGITGGMLEAGGFLTAENISANNVLGYNLQENKTRQQNGLVGKDEAMQRTIDWFRSGSGPVR